MSRHTVRDNPEESRYELAVDGDITGFIAYRMAGDVIDLVHTEVDDDHEGQGLGSELVAGALDDVRARGAKIRPSCSFVAAYIDEHPDARDLVAA